MPPAGGRMQERRGERARSRVGRGHPPAHGRGRAHWRRRAWRIGLWALAGLPLLALLAFALPITEWRTGQRKTQPLPLVQGGPPVKLPRRVWIDTDAACGHAGDADADDCFAL